MSPPPTIAIIGAGFSGTIVAAHLLQEHTDPALNIVMLDRASPSAAGVAFGLARPGHVLNVPAGRMSAFANDEDHFLRFAKERDVGVTGGSFVPRRLYGEYLAAILHTAEAEGARRGHKLERSRGEAVAVQPAAKGMCVQLADGRELTVDRVVLAAGNFAPANPPVPAGSAAFYESARYVRDPWTPHALDAVRPDEPVLLVGTGLTMLDVAVELCARGRGAPLYAISRRGLAPLPHRPHGSPPSYGHLPPELISCAPTAVDYLRAIRRHVRTVAHDGVDWREVVASLRPITPRLWHTLSIAERRRFLRHARPYWDAHRHRIAPELHHVVESLRSAGALQLTAARVLGYEGRTAGVDVVLRARGASAPRTIAVGHVINCTGPESDVRAIDEPLLRQLQHDALACADPLGLGFLVTNDLRLADDRGTATAAIWLVGPLLKGAHWEATAVPELRLHAARVARAVRASLALTPAARAVSVAAG